MNQRRPFQITILADYNILSVILIILSFFPFMKEHGILFSMPDFLKILPIPEEVIKGIFVIIILTIALGYLNLKKWGYWLIISEKLLFIVGWLIFYLLNERNSFSTFPLSSFIELIYIVPTYRYFFKKIN